MVFLLAAFIFIYVAVQVLLRQIFVALYLDLLIHKYIYTLI